jgi:hypothetical protein
MSWRYHIEEVSRLQSYVASHRESVAYQGHDPHEGKRPRPSDAPDLIDTMLVDEVDDMARKSRRGVEILRYNTRVYDLVIIYDDAGYSREERIDGEDHVRWVS